MRALALALCLLACDGTMVPFRDPCVADAAKVWTFMRDRPYPTDRPPVLEEMEAKTAVQLCRAMMAAPHLAPEDWRERVFGVTT